MSYKLFVISMLFGIFSCASHNYKRKLPTFTYNGASHNKLIVDRIPKYGDGERDGCIIMDEIDLSMKSGSNQSFDGLLRNTESQDILVNAQILIYVKSNSNPLSIKSDINGKFNFKANGTIDRIEVNHLALRTLTINMKKIKSLLQPK